MAGARLAALLTACSIPALVSCLDYDTLAPGKSEPSEPAASITVQLLQMDRVSLVVRVGVHPGTDDSGKPNPVSDPSLLIDGHAVHPDEESPQGYLFEEVRHEVQPAAFSSPVRITLPAISEGERIAVEVPLRIAEEPDTIMVASGEDVRVQLRTAAADTRPEAWVATLLRGDEGVARLQASGAPPNPIIIPASMIGDLAAGDVSVHVVIHSGGDVRDAAYRVSIVSATTIIRQIRLRSDGG